MNHRGVHLKSRRQHRTALLLAAATITCVANAQAQSNVAVSGYLDIGVFRDTADKWNVGTIGRSHLQFAGTEDLGGGLAATFKLRTRLDLDTGANEGAGSKPFWHGESTVGLKGGFGAVRLGRALDAIQSQDWAFDAWENNVRVASPAWDLWHWNYSADPHGGGSGRVANAIFYDSPTLWDTAFHLSYSPETQDGDLNRTTAVSAVYAAGPLKALLGLGRNSVGATERSLGLRGKLDNLSLMGMFNLTRRNGSEAKTMTLGAVYAFDLFRLKGGWGQADVDSVKKEKLASVGADYALSKRTSVFADIASKRFPSTGTKQTYGAGMSHSF
jgi:predicted porin